MSMRTRWWIFFSGTQPGPRLLARHRALSVWRLDNFPYGRCRFFRVLTEYWYAHRLRICVFVLLLVAFLYAFVSVFTKSSATGSGFSRSAELMTSNRRFSSLGAIPSQTTMQSSVAFWMKYCHVSSVLLFQESSYDVRGFRSAAILLAISSIALLYARRLSVLSLLRYVVAWAIPGVQHGLEIVGDSGVSSCLNGVVCIWTTCALITVFAVDFADLKHETNSVILDLHCPCFDGPRNHEALPKHFGYIWWKHSRRIRNKEIKTKTKVCSTNLWESFPVAAAVLSLVPLSDICIPKAESRSACFFRQEVQIAICAIATRKHRRERIFTKCCKVWLIISTEKCGCRVINFSQEKSFSKFCLRAHRAKRPFRSLKRMLQCFFMPFPSLLLKRMQRLLRQTSFVHLTKCSPTPPSLPHFDQLWLHLCIKLSMSNVSIK